MATSRPSSIVRLHALSFLSVSRFRGGRSKLRKVLSIALVFLGTLTATSLVSMKEARTSSTALELVRLARSHEQAHQEDLALRRYMEALSLDPTCEEAYLGLGSLRARRG